MGFNLAFKGLIPICQLLFLRRHPWQVFRWNLAFQTAPISRSKCFVLHAWQHCACKRVIEQFCKQCLLQEGSPLVQTHVHLPVPLFHCSCNCRNHLTTHWWRKFCMWQAHFLEICKNWRQQTSCSSQNVSSPPPPITTNSTGAATTTTVSSALSPRFSLFFFLLVLLLLHHT